MSLPYIFVDINDVKNLTENLEVIAISANLLLVAVFQISDGFTSGGFRCTSWLTRCENPNVYYVCSVLGN